MPTILPVGCYPEGMDRPPPNLSDAGCSRPGTVLMHHNGMDYDAVHQPFFFALCGDHYWYFVRHDGSEVVTMVNTVGGQDAITFYYDKGLIAREGGPGWDL